MMAGSVWAEDGVYRSYKGDPEVPGLKHLRDENAVSMEIGPLENCVEVPCPDKTGKCELDFHLDCTKPKRIKVVTQDFTVFWAILYKDGDYYEEPRPGR